MKRALPIAILVIATAVAFVLALGINGVIGYALGLPDGAAVTARSPAVAATAPTSSPISRTRARSKRQYIEAILARNIFDHTQIGKAATNSGPATVSDLNVRLLGTMVAQPEAFSSALIAEDDRDKLALGYGLGDTIEGTDAVIKKIEDKRVTIRRGDGSEEVLEMSQEDRPNRPAARSASRASSDDDETDGVSEVGDNKYEVSRDMLDKYLGDLDAIARMGRALPHKDSNGDIDGYRLSGIRRNSLAEKLGIRNGDVVHSVNGHNLTSMREAMDAWQTLQSEGSFTFEVTRRGQKVTMDYTVR